jgi:hypothetical protein
MAEPAAAGSDGPAAGRPDPDVRRALVTEARACRLAVEELARNPGDGPALEMARLVLSVLEHLGEQVRADEAVIEAERRRAVEEDRAAWPRRRRRGRLRALP